MNIYVKLPFNNSYKIFLNQLVDINIDEKVVIVTNDTVSKLHLNYLKQFIFAKQLSVCTILDGEKYKNMDTIDYILNHCFEQKLNRNSYLIAFGGGVIGDMTGFVASIYQRGINFIQIPTTLLSQVDASVGGKTGVNNVYGKNLIGSFYQPKAVYIDPFFLTTLSKKEYNSGISEIIKMAVIFDDKFFEWLKSNDLYDENNIKIAIEKSIKIKSSVVIKDEKEHGVRAALNYGHTFCHVIENETNYDKYLHGEAVGIGMNMANKLAFKLGFINIEILEDIKNLLNKYDIPTNYNIKDIYKFYDSFLLDKKSSNDKIKFILPFGIGNFKIKSDVDKQLVLDTLKEFS
jgi:3-dehydroquinate synthase